MTSFVQGCQILSFQLFLVLFQSEVKLKRQRSIEPTFIAHLESSDKPVVHLETVAEEGVDVGHLDAIHNEVEVPIGHDEVDDVSMQFAERELSKQIFIETDLAEKQLAEIYDDDIAKAKFPKKPGKKCFLKRDGQPLFTSSLYIFVDMDDVV